MNTSESAPSSTPAGQATPMAPTPTPKRFTKRSWITLGVAAGALVIAGAFAVPAIAHNIAQGEAIDALTASESELADAQAALVKANDTLTEAAEDAVVVFTDSGEFVKVMRAELISDAKTLEELKTARVELSELASLELEGEVATAPEKPKVAPLPVSDTPTTLEAMAEQSAANDKLADKLTSQAKSLRATVSDISAQSENILGLTEDVIASAGKFGAAVTGVEKAAAATVEGLTAAVAALKDLKTPAINRASTYVGAYDAVVQSHAAAVAAEQAAAEEAARQNGNGGNNSGGGGWNNGGGSNSGGGWNNGGGGGNNGGSGGNTGGGGDTGGGSDGGGWVPDTSPANFETGPNYIGYDSSICGWYSSHQVGWGGTSQSGRTLSTLGVPWSATVDGDTVHYYTCGW